MSEQQMMREQAINFLMSELKCGWSPDYVAAFKAAISALRRLDELEASLVTLTTRLDAVSRIVNKQIMLDERACKFWEEAGLQPVIPDDWAYRIRAALSGDMPMPPESEE